MTENPAVEPLVESMQAEIDSLRREVEGTQQMLGQVLQAVGHPVLVPKSMLHSGIPEGARICIDDDIEGDRFVFSLDVPE